MTERNNKPSLVIADDDSIFSYALARTLAPHYEVLATTGDGGAAISAVDEHQPDIVLMDISMPVMNGLIAAERLIKRYPGVLILFVTAHLDDGYIEEASRLGARGYVLKSRLTDLKAPFAPFSVGNDVFPVWRTERRTDA